MNCFGVWYQDTHWWLWIRWWNRSSPQHWRTGDGKGTALSRHHSAGKHIVCKVFCEKIEIWLCWSLQCWKKEKTKTGSWKAARQPLWPNSQSDRVSIMKDAANYWCGGGPKSDALQFHMIPCFMDHTYQWISHKTNILPERRTGERENIPRRSHYLVSSWSESSCFRCLERSFFSIERRTQARAFPTSVLISLMFWMCLHMENTFGVRGGQRYI